MVLRGKPRVIDGGVVTGDDVGELFRGIATEAQNQELERCGEIHFTYVAQDRFRIEATSQGESCSLRIKNIGR